MVLKNTILHSVEDAPETGVQGTSSACSNRSERDDGRQMESRIFKNKRRI